jgi:hypothetical protein
VQHFLFVPIESGRTEMKALTAATAADAVIEARQQPFGGRTGYLFAGDSFIRQVQTAAGVITDAPLADAIHSGRSVPPAWSPPRPG